MSARKWQLSWDRSARYKHCCALPRQLFWPASSSPYASLRVRHLSGARASSEHCDLLERAGIRH
eukprot:6325156-Prymnesium_polylepis.1